MPTLRCPACLRRWRDGGPYACDCLDTQEPPANEPPVCVVYGAPPPLLPWLAAALCPALHLANRPASTCAGTGTPVRLSDASGDCPSAMSRSLRNGPG